MWRSVIYLLIVGIVGCTDDRSVGELHASATTRGDAPANTALTLQRARQLLETPTGSTIGPIALSGYSFHREVEIGKGLRAIVISRNLGGGLLVFGADGVLAEAEETEEITWIQLFDLDEDGVSEIVTEEIGGRGTGVLDKHFSVYRCTPQSIKRVWTGESYSRRSPKPERFEETNGFLRFDASGGGMNARLMHLVVDSSGQQTQKTFEWRNGMLNAR